MPLALGLIETKGLVGAIEAADAMAKAANVRIVGREKVVPALITIKIVGDVAAVHAAVEAGAAAAQRVGQLVSKHVIAQPDEQMAALFPEIMESETPATKPEEKVEVVEQKPEPVVAVEEVPKPVVAEVIEAQQIEPVVEEVVPEPIAEEPKVEEVAPEQVTEPEIAEEVIEPVAVEPEVEAQPQEESEAESHEEVTEQQPESSESPLSNDSTDDNSSDDEESKKKSSQGENEEAKSDVDGATLVRLLDGNEPQTPPQQTTTVSNTPILYNGKDVSLLSVVELRNLARTVANFPIKGREISKANKTTLLAYFNS